MILMLGVAGSGKSTQSQLLAETGKYRWIYIGEVLRRTMTGQDAADMKAGKLLDSQKVINYLAKEIDELGEGPEIIIDGFPRSVEQADWLISRHASSVYTLTAVIYIDIAREVVMERLLKRGRPDDTEVAISERFNEFDTAIHPIIADLSTHGVPIITIDGSKQPQAVFADITSALSNL